MVPPSSGQLAEEAKLLDSGDVFDSLLLDGADGKLEAKAPRKKASKQKEVRSISFRVLCIIWGYEEKNLSLSNFMKFVMT